MKQIAMAALLVVAGYVYSLFAPAAWVPTLLQFIGGIWLLYAVIRAATRPKADA